MTTRRACLATLGAALAGCAAGPLLPEGLGVWPGARGEIGPANAGRIANLGWVAGQRGVLVVGSGVSARHGATLRAAIAAATAQPVVAVLLTHVQQDVVFGTSAFDAPVWMHADAARLMAARCERCLSQLRALLGEAEMQGSRLATPAHTFVAGSAAVPGIGRDGLQLLSFGTSASPGATAVWDAASRTLFAGALLAHEVIPDVQDADFTGWRAALDALAALGPALIVPGHGPLARGHAACQRLIAANRRYLDALDARASELLRMGAPLSEVANRTELPEFAGWDQYDTTHRRNASIVFLRHERTLLQGATP